MQTNMAGVGKAPSAWKLLLEKLHQEGEGGTAIPLGPNKALLSPTPPRQTVTPKPLYSQPCSVRTLTVLSK